MGLDRSVEAALYVVCVVFAGDHPSTPLSAPRSQTMAARPSDPNRWVLNMLLRHRNNIPESNSRLLYMKYA